MKRFDLRDPSAWRSALLSMFNLLTEQAQKNAKSEYRFRLAIVACIFIAGEILLALAGGVFSFVALREEGKRIEGDAVVQERARDARTGAELISSVRQTSARLEVLAKDTSAPLAQALAALTSLRPGGIKITALTAVPVPENKWSVSVGGSAATRDALAAFERALAGDRRFAEVALPLASFAKDEALPFTITAVYLDTSL